MPSRKKLILIDTGLFCEEMYIHAGIYFLYRGTHVLLCKNVVFTKGLIAKLRDVAITYGGIYIDESDYEEIWNESLRQYSVRSPGYEKSHHRVCIEYNRILSETVMLLGGDTAANGVPLGRADNISTAILKTLDSAEPSILLNCVHMIYEMDNYLYTHCVNVAILNGMVGKWMGMPQADTKRLIKVGLLHDLGKLKISPQILNKPGKLTKDEFDMVKLHPIYSCETLRSLGETDEELLLGVRQHHEKVNGQGYPDGLKNKDIVMAAQITAVSDVYDAMVSERCYKDAVTPFDVLALLNNNQFSDLNIQVVKTFVDNIVYLLVGTRVKLTTGDVGEVMFVSKNDYANPVVRIGSRIFTTGPTCRCVVNDKSGE